MLEKLNQSGRYGIGVAVLALMVGVLLLAFQLQGRTSGAAPAASKAFYTDDGKNFFKDTINKVPPFDHNGKMAYRADVFKGADGKEFVGLVYRYTANGKRDIENYIAKSPKDPEGLARQNIDQRGMEMKPASADEKAWQLADDNAIDKLRASVKTSSGAAAQLVTP